jgi:hypothetical protein
LVPIKATLVIIEDNMVDIGPTGPTGGTGPTGDTGPTGPIAGVIPFSIVNDASQQISTDNNGEPQILQFAGFSSNSEYTVNLDPGDWVSRSINFAQAGEATALQQHSLVLSQSLVVYI